MRGAHPRAGGENLRWAEERWGTRGSSPRGRGKLGVDVEARVIRGLIPARAGKTSLGARGLGGFGAHPRAGGENRHQPPKPDQRRGSSPRGRGKHVAAAILHGLRGLIPARAGKTGWGRL